MGRVGHLARPRKEVAVDSANVTVAFADNIEFTDVVVPRFAALDLGGFKADAIEVVEEAGEALHDRTNREVGRDRPGAIMGTGGGAVNVHIIIAVPRVNGWEYRELKSALLGLLKEQQIRAGIG